MNDNTYAYMNEWTDHERGCIDFDSGRIPPGGKCCECGVVNRSNVIERMELLSNALREASQRASKGGYYDTDAERAIGVAKGEVFDEIAALINSAFDF